VVAGPVAVVVDAAEVRVADDDEYSAELARYARQ
jgi:hypothetical protein